MDDWIDNTFKRVNGNELVLNVSSEFVITVSKDKFIDMFGGVIQTAIDNGLDVKQAIRQSDPDNNLGYNDLL